MIVCDTVRERNSREVVVIRRKHSVETAAIQAPAGIPEVPRYEEIVFLKSASRNRLRQKCKVCGFILSSLGWN